jgi:hypothetical protein
MSTKSQHLNLNVPTGADAFRTEDLADNWGKLDQYPGTFICTSLTRPTWGSAQAGMRIWETDTNLEWRFNGSQFVRIYPVGLLGRQGRTSDFGTANLTADPVVTVPVFYPAGGRWVEIECGWSLAENTAGQMMASLWRDNTQLDEWVINGRTGATNFYEKGQGGSRTIFDLPTQFGNMQYSFRIRSISGTGGTSTIRASTTSPAYVSASEV